MNVILDTNVMVSGLFFNGRPYRILKGWQSGQFSLFSTSEILDEYERVIKVRNSSLPKALLVSRWGSFKLSHKTHFTV